MKNKISGIYRIENTINGKCYIGQSVDIERRFRMHRSGKTNKHLCAAIKQYGIENFNFDVLEETSINNLTDIEQFWIDFHNACNPNFGYNLAPAAGTCAGYKHSDIARCNMRSGQKGRSGKYKKSIEQCIKIANTQAHTYDITLLSPDNIEFVLKTNLSKFAREHGLHKGSLYHLLNGTYSQHMGWRIKRNG